MKMKPFNNAIVSFCLGLALLPLGAKASITGDIDNFLQASGFNTNVTEAQAYQGQRAGYYTGGSLIARNPVRDVQVATLQLPSFKGGCGGIDLFGGGFSFIDSQALLDTLKAIANNAKSYAFMLAIETVSPLIASQMKYLQNLANTVNQANIHSCETAASLVGGLWPKTDVAQQQICAAIGTQRGLFTDWADARQQCSLVNKRNQAFDQGRQDPAFRGMLTQNSNIAWRVLQQHPFLQHDTELAELLMSLSGSLIVTEDTEAKPSLAYLKPLATEPSLLAALLHGGKMTLYRCDENQACLYPKATTILLDTEHAFGTKVKNLLQSMVDKILTDQPLSSEEIGLLQATSLPVYKMLNVNAAYVRGTTPLEVSAYSELIATDLLYRYLLDALTVVLTSSTTLPLPQAMLDQFRQGVTQARHEVLTLRQQTQAERSATLELIQRTQLIEQQLASQLSADMTASLTWANGLR